MTPLLSEVVAVAHGIWPGILFAVVVTAPEGAGKAHGGKVGEGVVVLRDADRDLFDRPRGTALGGLGVVLQPGPMVWGRGLIVVGGDGRAECEEVAHRRGLEGGGFGCHPPGVGRKRLRLGLASIPDL